MRKPIFTDTEKHPRKLATAIATTAPGYLKGKFARLRAEAAKRAAKEQENVTAISSRRASSAGR